MILSNIGESVAKNTVKAKDWFIWLFIPYLDYYFIIECIGRAYCAVWVLLLYEYMKNSQG